MNNPYVKYGVMYGVVSIILSLLIWLAAPGLFAKWWLGFLIMIIPIIFMVMAVREARTANGGYITFGSSFVNALLTMVIGSLLGSVFTYVLYNFIDPGLEDFIKTELAESMSGFEEMMGEDAFDAMLEGIEEQSFADIGTILKNILGATMIGAIISLIVAAIMKRNEPPMGLDTNV